MLRNYYSNTRSELFFDQKRVHGKVLEIGCGNGEYLKGCKCEERWGVEPFEVPSSEKIFDKYFQSTLEDCFKDLPSNYFDNIIMNDVLEHIWDTEDALFKVHSLLNDGGKFRVSIPNVRYVENLYLLIRNGTWDYKDFGILDKTHMRFFTPKSFKKYFQSGWKLQSCNGINPVGSCNGGSWKIVDFLLWILRSDSRFLQHHFVFEKIK